MTTLPTPESLRKRAAVALACAESATNTGRFTTDAARILTETQRAVALTAYARDLLAIAAQLEPAPSTAAPAEVSPPGRIATLAREYRAAEDAFDSIGYRSAGNCDDFDAAQRRRANARAALDAALVVPS